MGTVDQLLSPYSYTLADKVDLQLSPFTSYLQQAKDIYTPETKTLHFGLYVRNKDVCSQFSFQKLFNTGDIEIIFK